MNSPLWKMNKNGVKRIKMSLYTVGTLFRKGSFLFCGRRRDRIKELLREPDGYVLIYKRLSVKGGYQWPRNQSEVRNLTWREIDWLMSGIDIDQPKALLLE